MLQHTMPRAVGGGDRSQRLRGQVTWPLLRLLETSQLSVAFIKTAAWDSDLQLC